MNVPLVGKGTTYTLLRGLRPDTGRSEDSVDIAPSAYDPQKHNCSSLTASLILPLVLALGGCAAMPPPHQMPTHQQVLHDAGHQAREVADTGKHIGLKVRDAAVETGHAFQDGWKIFSDGFKGR